MKLCAVVVLLAASTISASARPVPPHRINKLGSKDSELNDPVAQAAVGNTDGYACTIGGVAIKCLDIK